MPKNPKDSFLKRFQDRHTIRRVYGQSFYELNSTAILYFRFSRSHKNQFFFGVESDDVSRYKDSNLFILFICEIEDEIVVIPVEDFLEMVKGSDPISNQWKVFISKHNGEYSFRVAGKGKYDVSGNLNKFDFRPVEFRLGSLASLGRFTPLGRKRDQKKEAEGISVVASIQDRLIASSSDSRRPTLFEKTVSEAFEKLGFKAKHIGGAGNTDILIESPLRGIIDCKSTSDDSLSQLNFARLKRHKKENDASFLLVIAKGFDRAVVRDAALEQCTLMPVGVLREILQINDAWAVSPLDLEPLLKRENLVSSEDCRQLRGKVDASRKMIESIIRVITALDFKPRALKEIKGRLDYDDESELAEILSLLSSPLLLLSVKSDGNFSSRYSRPQAIHRLEQLLGSLISPLKQGVNPNG
jgi:hypothetical protein